MATVMQITPDGTGIALGGGKLESNKIKIKDILYVESDGSNASILLNRPSSHQASWRLINNSGMLRIQSDYTDDKGDFYDVMWLEYNSGNSRIRGSLTLGSPLAIVSGGTGANSAANARKNLGITDIATMSQWNYRDNFTAGIPVIGPDGVMEVGTYIDFHIKNKNIDYDSRLQCNSNGSLTLIAPGTAKPIVRGSCGTSSSISGGIPGDIYIQY